MTTRLQPTRLQTWSDNLRLPVLQDAAIASPYLEAVASYRGGLAIPFQSRHLPALKRNTWFVHRRPSDRSRSGFLVLLPSPSPLTEETPSCVFVSGTRAALLRIRVDPQFLAPGIGPTIFIATLSGAARRLWLEDVVQWKGQSVRDPFSQRMGRVTQWLTYFCTVNPAQVGGVKLEVAAWSPLSALEPSGVWTLQSEEEPLRLLWIAPSSHRLTPLPLPPPPPPIPHTPIPIPIPTLPHKLPPLLPTPETLQQPAPRKAIAPRKATATRQAGPDQWFLTEETGEALGRALIRRFDISTALRGTPDGTTPVVEIVWAAAFDKWEIIGVPQVSAS